MAKLIVYKGPDELIVCTAKDEKTALTEWLGKKNGRPLTGEARNEFKEYHREKLGGVISVVAKQLVQE